MSSQPDTTGAAPALTPEQLRQARLVVAGLARSAEDARQLFATLGLDGGGPVAVRPLENPKRVLPRRS